MNPISVLVVDDSALMRNLIRRMLESDEEIEVLGVAMNGQFALRKAERLEPDVIVLDLEMPELDGIGFLEERQKRGWDVPVVILSAVAKKGAEVTMKALSLGASDFVTKPTGSDAGSNQDTAEHLIGLVKGFGSAYRRRRERSPRGAAAAAQASTSATTTAPPAAKPKSGVSPDAAAPAEAAPAARSPAARRSDDWPRLTPKRPPAPPEIVALGISTGGPNALRRVFAELSPAISVPIVVVQHMPPGFTAEFANSLDKICPLEVKEAADGDVVKPGRILIAPGNRHIRVMKKRLAAVAQISDGDNVNGHKPSAGVLFDSVAEQYGNAAVGIIMTGMGRDGSREIGRIYAEGGVTLAQDEESSVVFGMPRVAIEHDYITQVVSLEDMAGAINELTGALD